MLKGDIDLTEDMIFYNEKKQGDFKLPAVFTNDKLKTKNPSTIVNSFNAYSSNISWTTTSSTTLTYTNLDILNSLSHTNSDTYIRYISNDIIPLSETTADSILDGLMYSYPEYEKYVNGKWDYTPSDSTDRVSCLPPPRPKHKMYDDEEEKLNITVNPNILNSNSFGINKSYVLYDYGINNINRLSSNNIIGRKVNETYHKTFGKPKNKDMKYLPINTCSNCGKNIISISKSRCECDLCTHKNAIEKEMERVLSLFSNEKNNEMESICYDGLGLKEYVSDFYSRRYSSKFRRRYYRRRRFSFISDSDRYVKPPWLKYMTDSQYKTYIEDITYDLKYPDGGEEEGGNATRYLTDRGWLRLPG